MTNNLLINCRNSRRRDKRVTWGFFLSLINPTRVWQFLYKPVTQCGGLTMSDLPNILGGFCIQIQNNCYFKKKWLQNLPLLLLASCLLFIFVCIFIVLSSFSSLQHYSFFTVFCFPFVLFSIMYALSLFSVSSQFLLIPVLSTSSLSFPLAL